MRRWESCGRKKWMSTEFQKGHIDEPTFRSLEAPWEILREKFMTETKIIRMNINRFSNSSFFLKPLRFALRSVLMSLSTSGAASTVWYKRSPTEYYRCDKRNIWSNSERRKIDLQAFQQKGRLRGDSIVPPADGNLIKFRARWSARKQQRKKKN